MGRREVSNLLSRRESECRGPSVTFQPQGAGGEPRRLKFKSVALRKANERQALDSCFERSDNVVYARYRHVGLVVDGRVRGGVHGRVEG